MGLWGPLGIHLLLEVTMVATIGPKEGRTKGCGVDAGDPLLWAGPLQAFSDGDHRHDPSLAEDKL